MHAFPTLRREFQLLGQVDHANDRHLRGWAFAPSRPTRRLQLDFFYRDVFLGRGSTGQFRPDLLAQGLGDGRHGFVFSLPGDVPVRFDPAQLCVATAGPVRRILPFPSAVEPGGQTGRELPSDARQMLGPYLAALRDADAHPPSELAAGRRPHIDLLCAAEAGVVGGRTSAFVAHIARKYERPEDQTADEDGLWRWYLGTYAVERSARLPPLSRGDIDRLTTRGPALEPYVSRLFAAEIGAGEAAYRWAIEASHRLGVADCLVEADAAARLGGAPTQNALLAFPLSPFMRLARRESAVLRKLPVRTRAQRRRIYALFMVWGLRDPHILAYLPSPWLHRLLDTPDLLAATLAELFGAEGAIGREQYAALVAATGFDLATQTFRGRRYDGHRVLGGPHVVRAERPVDVQIFGPFSRRLGLGESCRRVARALDATPFSVNLVDYDLGNASPHDGAGTTRLGSPRAARLNILHLNAEEIPEAVAYLPDVFAGAPLVAIPYWELNRPAAVHRLGLRLVDEIWAASRFLADVFAEAGKPVHWIGMSASEAPVPSAADRQALRARYGLAPRTFVFVTTSDALSWAQRKNPLGVVEAFQATFARDEDVALVVKTHNLDGPLTVRQKEHWERIRALCAADPRMRLVNDSLDPATQRVLLAACDGFVSLHRAEGLGLDALDVLALGRSVVATAYSGTSDLCTPETSWPVAAAMRPVAPLDYCFVEPGHVWAEPSLVEAGAAMRGVHADTGLRDRRIAAGQRLVGEQATVASLARRLETRIREILDPAR